MVSEYKAALAATPADLAALVSQDQRDWLKRVPLYCPDPQPPNANPMPACLTQTYKTRIDALQKLISRRGGITFVGRTITRIVREEVGAVAPTQIMPGYGTLSASWPIAASPAPEWQAWNKAVRAAALRILSPAQKPGARDSSADWAAEPGDDNTIDVRIEMLSPTLITALVDGWSWRGAHPSETSIQLNWLLKERRELQPPDLFLPASHWKSYLQSRCNRFLHRTLDSGASGNYETYEPNGQMAKTLREIVANPRNWQLDQHGLSIVFQDYAVAPRVAHPGPLLIPWPDLKPYLNSKFAIPE